MTEIGSGNMDYRRRVVPLLPLKHTPYPVRIDLARSIDAVNNNEGQGWMQLAHRLGCSTTHIKSIETRADHEPQNSNSPTMVLFKDLETRYEPVLTIKQIEQALLHMNLDAVKILYKPENLQEMHRLYHEMREDSLTLDTNTEPSTCICQECIMTHEPPERHSHTPRKHELRQIHYPSGLERTPTSNHTFASPEIPQQRIRHGIGPYTTPPYIQSQESRNTNVVSPSSRIIPSPSLNTVPGRVYSGHGHNLQCCLNIVGEDQNGYTTSQRGYTQGQSVHGRRTMQHEWNNQDILISPDDNCQAGDEEWLSTCEISCELHYSDIPGNNDSHRQTSQNSEHTSCLLSDETFVKPSYDQEAAADCRQYTCNSSTNKRLGQTNSLSDPNLKHLQEKVNHGLDKKRNSMNEKKTDSFCNGKENGNCNHSMIPSQYSFSVFVTYSKHSREHVKEVIDLCVKLKSHGIRVRVDVSGDQVQHLFKNKHDWLDQNLKKARFIIVCISPTYFEDIDQPKSDTEPIPDMSRLDVRFIFDHMRTEYIRNCSQNKRVIPVIFENSGANRKHLPHFMATTLIYSYPRQFANIFDFLKSNTPGKSNMDK